MLLEDQLHARDINLHILSGICAGLHRPDGATIADKMLFMVAAMERDLIRERTLDGLRAAQAQGQRGGRPAAVDDDVLTVAQARRARGESVAAIARHLKFGRSTPYWGTATTRRRPGTGRPGISAVAARPMPDPNPPALTALNEADRAEAHRRWLILRKIEAKVLPYRRVAW